MIKTSHIKLHYLEIVFSLYITNLTLIIFTWLGVEGGFRNTCSRFSFVRRTTSSISCLKCSLDFSLFFSVFFHTAKKPMKNVVIPKASRKKSSMPGKLRFRVEYKILKRYYVAVGAVLEIGKNRVCLRLNVVNDL